MCFRLVPKSVALNDLERRNGRYIALFHWMWWTCVVAEFMHESIVFLVRVQCRSKESSRSLSHLLMSFLLVKVIFSVTVLVVWFLSYLYLLIYFPVCTYTKMVHSSPLVPVFIHEFFKKRNQAHINVQFVRTASTCTIYCAPKLLWASKK